MIEALQNYVNKTFKGWTGDMDFTQFVLTLDQKQRLAALVTKLNYSVGNGGFHQWHENGYSKDAQMLLLQLDLHKKEPIVAQVIEVVQGAMKVIYKRQQDIEDYESDGEYDEAEEVSKMMVDELGPYDDKYYDLEEEFLAYIQKLCVGGR